MLTFIHGYFRRWTVAAFAAALLLSSPPAAGQSPDDASAFRAVIAAQVEAFRRDAWQQAFSYASPGIRSLFGDAQRFKSMVLSGYEAVARPRIFEFEEAITLDGKPAQPVFVVGPDGVARRALYFMERQPDGHWKIDGVHLEAIADRSS